MNEKTSDFRAVEESNDVVEREWKPVSGLTVPPESLTNKWRMINGSANTELDEHRTRRNRTHREI